MVIVLGKKIENVVTKPNRRRQNSILSTIISYLRIYKYYIQISRKYTVCEYNNTQLFSARNCVKVNTVSPTCNSLRSNLYTKKLTNDFKSYYSVLYKCISECIIL